MKHMASRNTDRLSRRDFLKVTAGLGLSTAGMTLLEACGRLAATPLAEDAPPETTTIRLAKGPSICVAAHYYAEDFLKAEGFSDVQYLTPEGSYSYALSSGQSDIGLDFAAATVINIDARKPLVVLGGALIGCFELFGNEQIQTVADLKGKTLPVTELGSGQHVFLSTILTYLNIDPNKDVTFEIHSLAEGAQLFAEGKVDAYLAFPPISQELRAHKVGHVILNSMIDKPWSQYFCCLPTANRDFMQANPAATRRALRAILKGADACARQPEQVAQFLVDKGYLDNYDYALQTMQELVYNKWREYDPEDTIRFYALHLREAGLIKSGPDEIITQGTNWTFFNELKVELKG
jgi:NitT/TauT family transport system substrate-binding protein